MASHGSQLVRRLGGLRKALDTPCPIGIVLTGKQPTMPSAAAQVQVRVASRTLPALFGSGLLRKTLSGPTGVAATQRRMYASSDPTESILTIDQVDISRVRFNPVFVNKRGSKSASIMYEHPSGKLTRLRIQTPKCRAPFGLSTFTGDDRQPVIATPGAPPNTSVPLSLENYDKQPEMQRFYEVLQQLDERIMEEAVANAKDWFTPGPNGRALVPEFIKCNYSSPIKSAKDPKYAPTVRIKVPYHQGEPALQVFEEHEPSVLEAITPGSYLLSIIEPGAVWFIGNQYGVTWRMVQTRVEHRPNLGFEPLLDYAFLPEDEAATQHGKEARA